MILDSPKTYCNFVQRDGYIILKARGCAMICIPDVMMNGCKVRECLIAQAHSVLVHLDTENAGLSSRSLLVEIDS